MDRRHFLFLLSAICLGRPAWASPAFGNRRKLCLQAKDPKSEKFYFVAIDLANRESSVTELPYMIHSAISMPGEGGFLLTSKGARIFHIESGRIRRTLSPPKNMSFNGHSFLAGDGRIYTSAIDYPGFDGRPYRQVDRPEPVGPETPGTGQIFKIDPESLTIQDRFPSGGDLPHDLYVADGKLVVLNSAKSKAPSRAGGTIAKFDLASHKLVERGSCEAQKECPVAHHFKGKNSVAILGVTAESAFYILQNGRLGKRLKADPVDPSDIRGEFLNSAFLKEDRYVGVVSFDAGFLAVWRSDGTFLAGKNIPGLISVEADGDQFLVISKNCLLWYTYDLRLKKSFSTDDFGLKLEIIGPHSLWA